MRVSYDAEVDVVRIRLTAAVIDESDEVQPGFIVDYARDGSVVGFEILRASESVEDLPTLEVLNLQPTTVAA